MEIFFKVTKFYLRYIPTIVDKWMRSVVNDIMELRKNQSEKRSGLIQILLDSKRKHGGSKQINEILKRSTSIQISLRRNHRHNVNWILLVHAAGGF